MRIAAWSIASALLLLGTAVRVEASTATSRSPTSATFATSAPRALPLRDLGNARDGVGRETHGALRRHVAPPHARHPGAAAPVPEPGAAVIFAAGFLLFLGWRALTRR
jgi:hypothetical protein